MPYSPELGDVGYSFRKCEARDTRRPNRKMPPISYFSYLPPAHTMLAAVANINQRDVLAGDRAFLSLCSGVPCGEPKKVCAGGVYS